jgi:hypothetical protein
LPQVRKVAEDNGVDVTPQIEELVQRARQVRTQCVGWASSSGAVGPDGRVLQRGPGKRYARPSP